MSGRPRVVVTRAADGADRLSERLAELGLDVVAAPAIEIGPPRSYDELDRLARNPTSADWLLFLSRNAVRQFVQRCRRYRRGAPPVPDTVRVGVVGTATAATAQRAGLPVSLTSEGRTGEDLARSIAARASPASRLAVVQAEDGRPDAANALIELGFAVQVIAAYRTRSAKVPPAIVESIAAGEVDGLAFASPSSAVSLAIALGGLARIPPSVVVGAIGPTTAEAVQRAGRQADVVAAVASGAALAEAIAGALEQRRCEAV